jgi:hypothetical protein
MQLQAAVFVRASGAFGVGHVGWCVGLDQTLVDDGSVRTPFTPPTADGFWNVATTLPVGPFRYLAYDHYKVFSVSQGYLDRALEVVNWISEQPYFVLGRNCMDDVYDVLRAFGMQNLIPPYLAWIPNVWFQELPGQAQPISDSPLEWTLGKETLGGDLAATSACGAGTAIGRCCGQMPAVAHSSHQGVCWSASRNLEDSKAEVIGHPRNAHDRSSDACRERPIGAAGSLQSAQRNSGRHSFIAQAHSLLAGHL